VGSVTTLLLAETKESERMDTSSKQQRTYEESKSLCVGSVTTLLLAETKESDGYLIKTAKNIRREGV
jgi:hypothetical protein